ncbi:MAG: acetyltransferase [Oscillospiraceae bacterium]|nr:acetyltransferase [Oscillospiraceae bacterium]
MLLIIGTGGHAKVVYDAAVAMDQATGRERRIVFLTTDSAYAPTHPNTNFCGCPVYYSADNSLSALPETPASAIVAIGSNGVRRRLSRQLLEAGIPLETIIHPSAILSPSATIGSGTLVCAGTVVNPDAAIGIGAILNTGSIIEHDCTVGHFAHISPGAVLAGAVQVGEAAWVGMGARVLPGKHIGKDTILGAGAVLLQDLPDGCTAVGVPAHVIN